jgi:hypothetical protein
MTDSDGAGSGAGAGVGSPGAAAAGASSRSRLTSTTSSSSRVKAPGGGSGGAAMAGWMWMKEEKTRVCVIHCRLSRTWHFAGTRPWVWMPPRHPPWPSWPAAAPGPPGEHHHRCWCSAVVGTGRRPPQPCHPRDRCHCHGCCCCCCCCCCRRWCRRCRNRPAARPGRGQVGLGTQSGADAWPAPPPAVRLCRRHHRHWHHHRSRHAPPPTGKTVAAHARVPGTRNSRCPPGRCAGRPPAAPPGLLHHGRRPRSS